MEWKNDYYNPHEAMVARDNESFAEPSQSLIPVRWMSPESLLTAKYNMASDVWSYAVCCWEIFSLGTQPWLGYTNEEVMEIVIDRKQVLPCPEPCPLQLYNLLINCWAYQANSRPAFVRISGFLDQFRKSAKENPRKQYTAASTVSYNSQPYGAKNMYHQQVYSQQLPSSTDNSTVGVPPFMPGGVGCGGGAGSSIILPTPSPSHQMVQSRHQAPPASPAASHSHYRYPAGGTRSTTGSSTAGDSTGVVQVPEELLRPLIPNQANSPNMYSHNVGPASSVASSSLYRNNYNR